jgi:hypothetical protein
VNWQEILIRALISGVAGAASTGAVVMSAENAPKLRRKKKRRRRRRRQPGDAPPRTRKPTRAQKRARDKRRKEAEAAVADPGSLAIKHLAEISAPGLSTGEFLENLKGTGRSMKDGVGRLFGLGPRREEPPPAVVEDKRGRHGRRPDPPRAQSRRRRPKQTRQDGLEALKQDVMYLAKDGVKKKVKQTVVDATGMGDGVGKIKDVAEGIGDRAGDVADAISDVAKDGAERISETAGAVVKNAGELASSVRASLPEDVEAVGDGVKGIGRWLQGPGAQNYDGERKPRQLTGADGEVVHAKMDVVQAKISGDGSSAPSVEAAPFRPAEEIEHDALDDKRWAAVEPGATEERWSPALATVTSLSEEPAAAAAEPVEDWQVDESEGRGPGAGETVDAELLPAPDEDVVEARIDDEAPPPVRRHRS